MKFPFSNKNCGAADKFTLGLSFGILSSRILLLGVKNSTAEILFDRISPHSLRRQHDQAEILKGRILPSKILSSEILSRRILFYKIPLLGTSGFKMPYPWVRKCKIPVRKIPFFGILQISLLEILQALPCRVSVAPRPNGALNFASQHPFAVSVNTASKNSYATRAVKFIKFNGFASISEGAPDLAPAATANKAQAPSFTAVNFTATKAAKANSATIEAIIAKASSLLNFATSRIFVRLKNEGDFKEASRAY